MIQDNYQLLIEKLDQFIRKYYVNQLIRGSLYATGLILALPSMMSRKKMVYPMTTIFGFITMVHHG